jgi:hypothetical protein
MKGIPIPLKARSQFTTTLRAQARCSTQSTRAAVQLVTSCADSPVRYAVARAATSERGFIPSGKRSDRSSLPLAQLHPRNMLCARKRAVQPDDASCTSARYRLPALRHEGRNFILRSGSLPPAQPHPRNTPLRAALAPRKLLFSPRLQDRF